MAFELSPGHGPRGELQDGPKRAAPRLRVSRGITPGVSLGDTIDARLGNLVPSVAVVPLAWEAGTGGASAPRRAVFARRPPLACSPSRYPHRVPREDAWAPMRLPSTAPPPTHRSRSDISGIFHLSHRLDGATAYHLTTRLVRAEAPSGPSRSRVDLLLHIPLKGIYGGWMNSG